MEPDPLDIFFDPHGPLRITERRRPHWHQEGRLYFITWRMNDSIPREQREEILREREAWLAEHGSKDPETLSPDQKQAYFRLFNERVHALLDAGYGSCALRHPGPRRIVAEALKHFHGERYRLGSFAIAGNHVHVLVIPAAGHSVSSITHSWKSFTANEINRAMGRTGPFWKHESYDHIVRDKEALERIEAYILRHVEKGALVQHRPTVPGN